MRRGSVRMFSRPCSAIWGPRGRKLSPARSARSITGHTAMTRPAAWPLRTQRHAGTAPGYRHDHGHCHFKRSSAHVRYCRVDTRLQEQKCHYC